MEKIKKFLLEFKDFAMRGNMLDMAVGVVIGGAFTGLVTALVENLISPLIALFTGSEEGFQDFYVTIFNTKFPYGAFLSALIHFIIMAFVVFLLVKIISAMQHIGKHEDAPAAPTTKVCQYCKSEIPLDATRCCHCTSILEEVTAGQGV